LIKQLSLADPDNATTRFAPLNWRYFKSRPKVSHPAVQKKTNPTHYASTSGKTFDKNQICEIIVKESIEYIGTIAKIVCADYMKSQPDEISLNSLRKLIDIIVLDINDDTKGYLFKDRVRSLLKIT
jgi:hypothetical protein